MQLMTRGLAGLLLLLAAGAALWLWWPAPQPLTAAPETPSLGSAQGVVETPEAGRLPTGQTGAPLYPIEVASSASSAPGTLLDALAGVLGRDAMQRFLLTDDLVRRVVVTVDNFGHELAPSRLWPVLPIGGRMQVDTVPDGLVLAERNAARYQAFIDWLTALDTARVAAVYRRFYPRFQQAYEELGYPGRHFNDRLVAVIDHLRSTALSDQPIWLVLPEVHGPIPLSHPWLHYEFADPDLESESAGRKILVRIGPENAGKLLIWLTELRDRLTRPAGGPG